MSPDPVLNPSHRRAASVHLQQAAQLNAGRVGSAEHHWVNLAHSQCWAPATTVGQGLPTRSHSVRREGAGWGQGAGKHAGSPWVPPFWGHFPVCKAFPRGEVGPVTQFCTREDPSVWRPGLASQPFRPSWPLSPLSCAPSKRCPYHTMSSLPLLVSHVAESLGGGPVGLTSHPCLHSGLRGQNNALKSTIHPGVLVAQE